jgi:hypothetical protein
VLARPGLRRAVVAEEIAAVPAGDLATESESQ